MQEPIILENKEPANGRTRIFVPLLALHLGDCGEFGIIIRERALAPVFHHKEHVCAVLNRGQPHGVGQIIPDIKRHPSIAFCHHE